jgi:thiol-disulfide isomerase/thioredoxin
MQPIRTLAPRAAVVLALAVVSVLPAAAQPADAVLRDFQPSGDYIVVIDGTEAPKAELYQSQVVPGFLIVANQLASPTLVLPREQSVQTVSFMKLIKRDDGVIDIGADAQLTPVGPFQVQGDGVLFTVDGKQVALRQRPFLLGLQQLGDMLAHSPDYRRKAAAYEPDAGVVKAIRDLDGKQVKVRVYFGSWCHFCKEYVPKMLRVAEQLEGSKIAFEFYGLPQGFGDEPIAKRDDIHGVPTGIVYVGGKEVGRIESQQWTDPEGALRDIVANS